MKKLFTIVGAVVFATIASTGLTKAATFDFAYIADNVPPGEVGGQPLTFSDAGIGLEARGFLGGQETNAYLDGSSGGNPAGLGVCSTGLDGSNECIDSSDDNVTSGETLQLTFSQKVVLDDISFRDAGHLLTGLAGGSFSLVIDGGSAATHSIAPGDWSLLNGLMGTVFEFSFYDTQFYINAATVSAVPLPPAFALFGAAVFGIGWLSRRRKQS